MRRPLSELDQSEGKGKPAYRDYFNALARILANDPEDEELDRWRDEEGHVKATLLNVAQLAGRKPQRLMGKDTPFPVLAAYIRSLKADHGVKPTTTARLRRQAEDIVTLVQRLKAVRSRLAESIVAREDLASQLAITDNALERVRKPR